MKGCRRKAAGILLIVFGSGLLLCQIMPLRITVFLLTLIILCMGFLIFRIC